MDDSCGFEDRATLPFVKGAIFTAETSTTIVEGKNFIFTLTLEEGYKHSVPVVKVNGKVITPNANGRYIVKDVRSNLLITVTGIQADKPTSNEALGSQETRVWSQEGVLHLQTVIPETAYIVTLDGRIYQIVNMLGGHYEVTLPQGIYIIRLGNKSYKVQI